mgnify:CR=1 FL=1
MNSSLRKLKTLYIEGKEYVPEESAPNNAPVWNTPRGDRYPKRARATSTPDRKEKGCAGEQTFNNIKLFSLNVCGIKNRQKTYKEFNAIITNFDVIGLTETKTDDADNILIPGYVILVKKNDKRSRRPDVEVSLLP